MNKVYCYDCRYLKRRFENYFDWIFVNGKQTGARWSRRKFLMPHALCRRGECFEIIDGEKVRIKGQAQLNCDHDCSYYKKKWWKK